MMEIHELAQMFPILEGVEFEVLCGDIKNNGLLNPIVTFEGKILDGRNRALACEKIGVKIRTEQFKGTWEDALCYVWSENRIRRHLNPSQIAIAVAFRDMMHAEYAQRVQSRKAEGRQRQKDGGKEGGKTAGRGRPKSDRVSQLIGQPYPDPHEQRTAAIRAREAGTNREYMPIADDLVQKRPELAREILSGKKSIPQVKRELNREELLGRIATLPSDKYRVIYADPPWKYGNSGPGLDNYGPAERHYPAMPISELCAMPIADIAEQNAVLFLWVTSPLLAECWPVIKAWGFEYKTSFVWDKVKHNFGHYNSVRHEFLLVCTRGSCTPDAKELYNSVQTIERTAEHSEKPEEFRAIIDVLYRHGKRIELFARKETSGWDIWPVATK